MSKTGKNQTDLLDLNRTQVLRYLVQHKGCSRAELGAATGLTLASITKILHALLDSGAVYETGYAEGKKGRRSVGLSLNYDQYKVLAVRLSWARLEMNVFDFLGNALGEAVSLQFSRISIDSIERIASQIIEGANRFLRQFPDISALGLAVPGPYYRETGRILLPPYSKDPNKRHYYPIKDRLASGIDLPIFIEHDADVGALAYWWHYANSDPSLVVMNVFASDGIGGGIVDRGRIFTGTSSSSCEIGHITIDYNGRKCMCGSNGCLNAYCDSRAIEEDVKTQLQNYPESLLYNYPSVTMQAIIQAMKQNDELARKAMYEAGNHLGHGIISLLHVFDPGVLVVSGSLGLGGEVLLRGMNDAIAARQASFIMLPKIVLFDADTDLTLLGAATYGMDRMLDRPTEYMKLNPSNIC